MHILKDSILDILRDYERIINSGMGIDIRVNDHLDTVATLTMLEGAKVVVFDTEQALALLPAIEQFEEQLDFRLPFPAIMFQFTSPIPETDLLQQERDETDSIQAIIVTQEDEINNASAWFESTAVNRVQWKNAPVADFRIAPRMTETTEGAIYLADRPADPGAQLSNKQVIRLLVCAMVAYINCDNIELAEVAASATVNAKRRRKGKKELRPYYTVKVAKVHRASHSEGQQTGRSVSFRFDVRGHFRTYKTGKTIWVNSHQRGLAHEHYIPKAYRVE